jgi:hypothetical protein
MFWCIENWPLKCVQSNIHSFMQKDVIEFFNQKWNCLMKYEVKLEELASYFEEDWVSWTLQVMPYQQNYIKQVVCNFENR